MWFACQIRLRLSFFGRIIAQNLQQQKNEKYRTIDPNRETHSPTPSISKSWDFYREFAWNVWQKSSNMPNKQWLITVWDHPTPFGPIVTNFPFFCWGLPLAMLVAMSLSTVSDCFEVILRVASDVLHSLDQSVGGFGIVLLKLDQRAPMRWIDGPWWQSINSTTNWITISSVTTISISISIMSKPEDRLLCLGGWGATRLAEAPSSQSRLSWWG